jgi:DNA-binding NarL/FixJ family response regulator
MIYVIEDDELKARRITNFLADKYPEKAVELYRSYNSGLRAIEQRAPELILLDMSLPTFDSIHGNREGRPRPYGGRDLMRKLKRKHISTKVIIVTGLEGFGEGDSRQTLPELTKE